MQGRFPIRAVAIFCVLVLSTAAALWLGLEPGLSIAPGHVVAQEFRLSPVETGRLAAVLVMPGQRVLGGQLIARLDTSVIEREMAVVEARVRQLGAEASASSAALQSEGYQTERSFESDAADAAGQLESARAEHAQQAAELKELGEELKRQKEYLREGLVKRDRVDELDLRRNTLADTVSEWPARLKELNARYSSSVERLSQWRSRYSANSAPVLREIRVKPLKQRVAEEIEALRVLRARLENAKLVAPADGEVVSVLARPGDVVRPGEPFVLLNGIGLREVVAYVHERQATAVRPGSLARIRRRTPPREVYSSRVLRVAKSVAPLPPRFWISPQLATWGREVVVEVPSGAPLYAGEALEVTFVNGGES